MNIQRLEDLRQVITLFAKAEYNARVKLNGIERRWDMTIWDCGTSACALGSYALSDIGKANNFPIQVITTTSDGAMIDASIDHFDINVQTAHELFMPSRYTKNQDDYISPRAVLDRIDLLLKFGETNAFYSKIRQRGRCGSTDVHRDAEEQD